MLNKKMILSTLGEADRLETPRTVGYRSGMTSSGIIGRRLGHLYEVPEQTPRRIDELLECLDRRSDGE